jgi:pilus assembly protein Flp/PilA
MVGVLRFVASPKRVASLSILLVWFGVFPECVAIQTAIPLAMTILYRLVRWNDTHGQDLIEYALMAGFVAVSSGAVMPGVASGISTSFSKVGSVLKVASTQGS